jgi:AraC-like DNA-binding protein
MIALQTATPSAALRGFARVYAQREVTSFLSGAVWVTEPVPARLEQTLEFQLGAPFTVHLPQGDLTTPEQVIIGAHVNGTAQIDLCPGVISFAIFLMPTGLSQLFGFPVSEVSQRNFDAAMVLGMTRGLRERLGACATFEQRVRVVEDALLPLAARARRRTLMTMVADHIFVRRGVVDSVERLAADAGLGIRQFERLFLSEIGVSPKLYARVARFQNALDMKIAAPRRTWLEIAHRLSYHDQMHMIRDFQLLGGGTPSQLLARIGDGRPGAVAEGDEKQKYFAR